MRRQFVGVLSAAAGGTWLEGMGLSLHASVAASSGEIIVGKGDTLWGLGRVHGVSVDELVRTNNLSGTTLRVGQRLKLPSTGPAPVSLSAPAPTTSVTPATSSSHVVSKGETLSSIAKQHKVSLSALRDANPQISSVIYPGDRLVIPSTGAGTVAGSGSAPSAPAPTAAKAETKAPSKAVVTQPSRAPAVVQPKRVYVGPVRKQVEVANIQPKKWRHIILHHSGTATGNGAIFDYYHRQVRGMENGLAYHFVIGNGSESRDGEIEVAERWRKQLQGGHVRSESYNQNSIGICLVGDFQRSRPTRKQMAAAMELIEHLRNGLVSGSTDLLLHRDIQKTVCPGRYFPEREVHRVFG